MPSKKPVTIAAAAALAALAVGVPAASADSIAYVKDGNVWLSTTDGSRTFQVTSTGGYNTVSQADDGTLLGTTDGDYHLRRLDRMGNVLSDIATPVSDHTPGLVQFNGPFDADISPDGKNAGYTFFQSGFSQSPDGTIYAEDTNGSAFTHSDALTGFTDPGYKYTKGWDAPDWIDNENVIVSNGPGYPSDPISVTRAGTDDEIGLFTDPTNPHPLDATMSRNKRVIAAADVDRKKLYVYRDGTQTIDRDAKFFSCYSYSSDHDVRVSSPTISSDGRRMWWANGTGIETAPLPDMSSSCGTGVNSADILPGASSPDWGPADVPAGRPAAPAPAPAPATPVAPAAGTTGTKLPAAPSNTAGASGAKTVSVSASKVKLAKALKSGLTLKVSGSGAITASARAGGKVIASGKAPSSASSVKLTFAKAARGKLRKAKKVVLKVTVKRGSASATKTITLKK